MLAPATRFGQAFVSVLRWMNNAGVVWIFALMFLICADIVGRTVFDSPIRGVPEMVALSLVGSVFLQIAFAIVQGRLTRSDMAVAPLERREPELANDWQAFLAAVGAVLFVLMAMGAWPDFVRSVRTEEFAGVEGLFKVQVWPVKLLLVVGAAAAALELTRQLFARLRAALAAPPKPVRVWVEAVVLVLALAVLALALGQPSERTIGGAMIGFMLAFIALGMPIAIALLATGFLGLTLLKNDAGVAVRTLSLAAEGTISEYVFVTVPLFVLMGLFVNVSEIGRDAFRTAQLVFGRIRGGLGVATVAANAVFAAITGISIASAAIFTKIAVPEMVRHGYTAKFAVGLTAGSSVLGMLIPPSLLLIIYGVIAEVSIGDLFLGAVVPGIVLALAFAVGTVLMAFFWPSFVGRTGEARAAADGAAARNSLLGMLPVLGLIVLVLGGIYGGVFTPTEAGAAGAFGAMCIALSKRRLGWTALWDVIRETGQVSVAILFLIISASTFSRMLTLTELPQDMAQFLAGTGLGMPGFLAAYLILLLVLGMVLDSTSILLILLPFALPVVTELGGNLVWFGIVTVIGVEIGLLTPPFGLSVFVIKSSLADDSLSLGAIFAGAFPFVLITTAVTILLMAFPAISTFLL